MASTVRITLEGLPERVHELADVLDVIVPDTFEWHGAERTVEHVEIQLRGVVTWDARPEPASLL